jgi:hypothetical protein
MSTSDKREVVVRPMHRDEPDLHKVGGHRRDLRCETSKSRTEGEPPGWSFASQGDRHLQSVLDQIGAQVVSDHPPDDPTRVRVNAGGRMTLAR